ncbi:SURF1 family protein [Bradyrhizobium sp. STM 3557]|uniref:SURF1 family protein n=1 Tax=Bradyrhizobium sp. STM 3557 TaxID=578920 RepID=UPI00388D6A5C
MTTAIGGRGTRAFAAFTALMVAIFIGLGVWQLARRAEKHALIAALEARITAAPVPLPPSAEWPALNAANDEFRRVTFTATYLKLPDAMVYSAGSAVREDVSGPGTWAFLPARLASGETVVIDTGFIANTMQERSVEDRAAAKLITGEPITLAGYLRFPESAGLLTPADNRDKRLWFTRDHLAMAKALGWGEVAPFYIDLETPVPDNGIPKPGPLTPHLRDEHMQYAITWFSLAAALVIAFAVWARGRRAQRP